MMGWDTLDVHVDIEICFQPKGTWGGNIWVRQNVFSISTACCKIFVVQFLFSGKSLAVHMELTPSIKIWSEAKDNTIISLTSNTL